MFAFDVACCDGAPATAAGRFASGTLLPESSGAYPFAAPLFAVSSVPSIVLTWLTVRVGMAFADRAGVIALDRVGIAICASSAFADTSSRRDRRPEPLVATTARPRSVLTGLAASERDGRRRRSGVIADESKFCGEVFAILASVIAPATTVSVWSGTSARLGRFGKIGATAAIVPKALLVHTTE